MRALNRLGSALAAVALPTGSLTEIGSVTVAGAVGGEGIVAA